MLRMKNRLFSTFKFLFVSLLLAIPCASVKAANELEKNIEEIANQNYFRLSSIELLYDKYRDYEKAFECKTIMENVTDKRIDASCMHLQTGVPLTLAMFKAENGYITYVIVCPHSIDDLDPFNLKDKAYQSDKTIFSGSDATSYYMGRTNGWIRDFENIFLTSDMGFMKASCWALNKR